MTLALTQGSRGLPSDERWPGPAMAGLQHITPSVLAPLNLQKHH